MGSLDRIHAVFISKHDFDDAEEQRIDHLSFPSPSSMLILFKLSSSQQSKKLLWMSSSLSNWPRAGPCIVTQLRSCITPRLLAFIHLFQLSTTIFATHQLAETFPKNGPSFAQTAHILSIHPIIISLHIEGLNQMLILQVPSFMCKQGQAEEMAGIEPSWGSVMFANKD